MHQVGGSKNIIHQYNNYDNKVYLWIHFHMVWLSTYFDKWSCTPFINDAIEFLTTHFLYDIQPYHLLPTIHQQSHWFIAY